MIARYEVSLDLTEASSFFGVIVHERECLTVRDNVGRDPPGTLEPQGRTRPIPAARRGLRRAAVRSGLHPGRRSGEVLGTLVRRQFTEPQSNLQPQRPTLYPIPRTCYSAPRLSRMGATLRADVNRWNFAGCSHTKNQNDFTCSFPLFCGQCRRLRRWQPTSAFDPSSSPSCLRHSGSCSGRIDLWSTQRSWRRKLAGTGTPSLESTLRWRDDG